MSASLNGSKEEVEVLIRDVGDVMSMALDMKSNKLYWSSFHGNGGSLSIATISGKFNTKNRYLVTFLGSEREQLMSEPHILPSSLTFLDGKLYLANKATNAIEVYENGKYSVLHENVNKITSLAAAYIAEQEGMVKKRQKPILL